MKKRSLLLLILLFSACKTSPQAEPVLQDAPVKQEVPLVQKSCAAHIQDMQARWDFTLTQSNSKDMAEEILSFERKFLSREEVLGNLRDFFEEFFRDGFCTQTLYFQTLTVGGFSWKGEVSAQDAQAYFAKTISWPEWTRRMQLIEEASLDGIKARLRDAIARKDQADRKHWAESWLKQDPQNSIPYLVLGNLALEKKIFSEAISHYDSVLAIDPKNETALFNRAFANAEAGRLDFAIGQYQEFLDRFEDLQFHSTTRDVLRLHLASLWLKSGNSTEAEKNLNLVVSSSFEKEILLLELQRAKKDFAGAEQRLKKLRDAYPSSEIVGYNSVVIALDLKDWEQATTFYTDLQKISPESSRDFVFLEKWQAPANADLPSESDVIQPGGANAP